MSLRTAIAHGLVDVDLMTETAMYGASGLTAVDQIAERITTDALRNDGEQPALVDLVARAIDPYGADGGQVSPTPPSATEVISRMRDLGIVLVLDRQRIVFHNPPLDERGFPK